jgi:catechol 2,3-dioxygenase-like lactoylglutathione lyase family enzyme
MPKIRHIAISSDNPSKAAEFYKTALGLTEVARYNLPPGVVEDAPRPSTVVLTDGHISIALLKFGKDQTGVGLEYQGLHHIGFVVDDPATWTSHLEAHGAPNITRPEDMPKTAHWEIKFRGPDNVVFDISHLEWPGAEKVDGQSKKIPVPTPAE